MTIDATAAARSTATAGGETVPAFNRATLFALLVAGLVSALAFIVLSTFVPPFDAPHAGGGDALSRAGTGFSAIVDLAAASGTPARVSRDARVGDAGLLVLTPEASTDAAAVDWLVRARRGAPVLIVLPKWATSPDPTHPQWIETHDRVAVPAAPLASGLLAPTPRLTIAARAAIRGERLTAPGVAGVTFVAPPLIQTIAGVSGPGGNGVDGVVTAADGAIILGWQSKRDIFILADPDLLDNAGMANLANARAAVALLRDLGGARPGGIVFDVTLNGLGQGRDLFRLMLEPPFLGLTLALVAVAALATWQAAVRFGTPSAAGRAIAFGSAALIDNITALIATAKREGAIAPRYAALVGATVAARRHAPAGLTDRDRAAWLDRVGGTPRFGVLAHDAALVETPAAALASARALYRWQMEALHDR